MKKPCLLTLAFSLLLVALLCACDRPNTTPPEAEPGKPLLIFERSGGIAGFQDHLVLGYDGQYYVAQGSAERIGSLSAETMSQLREWYVRLAPFTLRLEDNPGGPDNMLRQTTWVGLGKQPASQAEQQELLKWAGELLAQLTQTN